MSIENFERIYPKNSRLTSIIEEKGLVDISPVASLARNFALEAGSGLRELLKGMNRNSRVGFALDLNSFVGVPTGIVDNIIRHHVGVIYGVSLEELEHSMIEGYFDIAAWCSLYNVATAGTPLDSMKAEEWESVEKLDKDHLRAMREFAVNNKDFSGFFAKKEGIALLPAFLKTMFNQTQMLPIIQREIIPIFGPRAALLVSPNVVKSE